MVNLEQTSDRLDGGKTIFYGKANRIMKKLIAVTLLFALFQACIEDFDVNLPIRQKLLVVDGSLTDQSKDQFVSIQMNEPALSVTKPTVVLDATVEVIVNNKDRIRLTDKLKNGRYYLPVEFKPQVNTDYKLSITTKEGVKYESSNERMTATPKIDDLKIEFKPAERKEGTGQFTTAFHQIYITTKDVTGIGNNYFWTWKAWEKQNICLTCDNTKYRFDGRQRLWRCTVLNPFEELSFDYPCNESCWDVFNSPDLNVLSDVYIDGNEIKDRLAAKIPYLQYSGVLVELTQQCVSQAGYRYMKLLIEQGQNTGTLADTPPAALVGNIQNVSNPREPVGGIFMVSGTDSRLIWIDRKDVPRGTSPPPGLLGREPNTEDAGFFGLPFIACVNDATRTNKKPIGWRD